MPDDELRLRPDRFVAGGDALARDTDGRVVFVRGGVPGDDVTAVVVERKGEFRRTAVTRVHEASPDRVDPPCPQRRAGCGGCDWQHVAVPAQLAAKVDVVRDAFRRTARLAQADIAVGAAVAPEGYRTSVRVVGNSDGEPSYRLERSHDTISAAGCMVAHPALHELLELIRVPAGAEVSLRVSSASGERTAHWDRRLGDVIGLPGDVGTGAQAAIHEVVAGHRFRVSASSFFQSGPAAAELLVEAVRRMTPELSNPVHVLDAYAGVGLFALATTHPASDVVTVESARSAVADARVNLAGRRATIDLGEFSRWRPPAGRPIDVVIADPARSGLAKPGVASVVRTGAPTVVLVSCDPASAARDAALLTDHGYRHERTEVLDVFPHTHHVECVTRYVRAD